MKVSREKAAEHRATIVRAAGRLFRERGLRWRQRCRCDGRGGPDPWRLLRPFRLEGGIGGGGLRHGPDAPGRLLAQPAGRDCASTSLAAIADSYLTTHHRDNPGRGCLFAAFGGEVGRQPLPVRSKVGDGLQAYVAKLAGLLPGRGAARRREQAIAAMAGFVGAMILSRAVSDPVFSEEILRSTAKDDRPAR